MHPLITAYRYTDRKAPDPFAELEGYQRDEPIFISAEDTEAARAYNTDVVGNVGRWTMQEGAPRFRHGRSKTCNVLFADGSVRGTTWDPTRKKTTAAGGVMNDFLRKYLMIKWPTGVPFRSPFTE